LVLARGQGADRTSLERQPFAQTTDPALEHASGVPSQGLAQGLAAIVLAAVAKMRPRFP
jgi:hypothetical protein